MMRWIAVVGTLFLSITLAAWAWVATPQEFVVHTLLLRPETFWSQWFEDHGLVLDPGPMVSTLAAVVLEIDEAPKDLVADLVGEELQRWPEAYRDWSGRRIRWVVPPSGGQLFVSVRHRDPETASELGRSLAERAALVEFDGLRKDLEGRRQLWADELALPPELPGATPGLPLSAAAPNPGQLEVGARVVALDRYLERTRARLEVVRSEVDRRELEAWVERASWQRQRLVDADLVRALGVVDRGADALSTRYRELQIDTRFADRWEQLEDRAQRLALQLTIGDEPIRTPVERNVWWLVGAALLLPWFGLVGAQLLAGPSAQSR